VEGVAEDVEVIEEDADCVVLKELVVEDVEVWLAKPITTPSSLRTTPSLFTQQFSWLSQQYEPSGHMFTRGRNPSAVSVDEISDDESGTKDLGHTIEADLSASRDSPRMIIARAANNHLGAVVRIAETIRPTLLGSCTTCIGVRASSIVGIVEILVAIASDVAHLDGW
jgi:hypothetical protein